MKRNLTILAGILALVVSPLPIREVKAVPPMPNSCGTAYNHVHIIYSLDVSIANMGTIRNSHPTAFYCIQPNGDRMIQVATVSTTSEAQNIINWLQRNGMSVRTDSVNRPSNR